MSNQNKLVLLPSLTGFPLADGRVSLTRKFMEGVEELMRFWQGPVSVLLEAHAQPGDNLDNMAVAPRDLPFSLKIVNFDALVNEGELRDASVALGSTGYRQNHIPKLCHRLGVAFAITSEYSLTTRYQIADSFAPNWSRKIRQRLWELRQERRQVQAIRQSQGLQCNGTPTYEAYKELNPNPMLFFDTRVTQAMLATRDDLDLRWSHCLKGEPLRLLFSGRLIPMKGAEHLIETARHLRDLGVKFELTICGDGESSTRIEAAIRRHGLGDRIHMTQVLDFHRELIPKVKRETDLFVCCHRQGDPSCTYLETMSCGVPIVGYDNEAFRGVVRASGSGWLTPMNQPLPLALRIAELDRDRGQLVCASNRALAFASAHTFEQTFSRRVEHLRSLKPARSITLAEA